MSETHTSSRTEKPKAIPSTSSPSINGETSLNENPMIEFPVLFRGLTENGAQKAKEHWQTMKSATDKLTATVQDSYSAATKESVDYFAKIMETASSNAHSAFDLANALAQARTPSEIIEVSAAHARKQMDRMVEQNRQLWTAAQKIGTAIAKPLNVSQNSK